MSAPDNITLEMVESLWTAVFGEPPSIRCDPRMLADVLIRNLPHAPPYGDPPGQRDREPLAPTRQP